MIRVDAEQSNSSFSTHVLTLGLQGALQFLHCLLRLRAESLQGLYSAYSDPPPLILQRGTEGGEHVRQLGLDLLERLDGCRPDILLGVSSGSEERINGLSGTRSKFAERLRCFVPGLHVASTESLDQVANLIL